MKKVNEDNLWWEAAAHEDADDPGVLKKVIVSHDDVDPKSKLMMVNMSRVPVGKTHKLHSHESMEEIFYFTDGQGEVKVGDEIEPVKAGDRVIVPAGSLHSVKNTGSGELKYIGIGISLD